MGERVLANGRSGTRELPFCLAPRTILHPVRRLPTRPPSLLAAPSPSAPSSFPLSRRDILRTPTFRNSGAQKAEAVKFFLKRTPAVDHPSAPFAIWRYLSTSTCIGRVLRPCVRVLFLFIVASWFHLFPGERGRRMSTRWDKWGFSGETERNPARWQVIITGAPKNGKISTASYRLRQRGEVEGDRNRWKRVGKGPLGD